jgi:putative ATPase
MLDQAPSQVPLAEQLRPRALDEVIGQSHLLGPGRPLRLAFASRQPHSMILWGPPGVGKTTLARLMADAFDADFIALSAVLSGVKDIREAIERAQLTLNQFQRHTILFVDEVHRFNKAQQDAFLPYVEQGLITFIGATTENPSFEVNSALLSRATVYVLHALSEHELALLLDRVRAVALAEFPLDDDATALLLEYADGDARRLLNMVEQVKIAAQSTIAAQAGGTQSIGAPMVRDALSRGARRFDKGGDQFYDQISALHKSVRGSDPDAALYWLVRMLDGGADPRYLLRRVIRMAAEDIGLADPRGLMLALDAAQFYERLGTPEGELGLAEAVLYLAAAPKSNAAYVAYNKAREFVAQDKSREVPMHLRNAPTRLMKELGHGKHYRYAHDEPEAYAAGENYFPDGLVAQRFYQPTSRGLEAKIKERLAHLHELDQQAEAKKT